MIAEVRRRDPEPEPARLLRAGILGLAALGIAGTTLELLFLGHWDGALQLIAWPAVIVLGVATALLVARRSPRAIVLIRALAVVGLVIGLAGVAVHVWANLEAGPLDQAYETTWAGLTAAEQLWLAATGAVGPAPVLAPAALGEISLMVALATIAHPALRARPD